MRRTVAAARHSGFRDDGAILSLLERPGVGRVVETLRTSVTGPQLVGLTGVTLQDAPPVCQGCVWWQSRTDDEADKSRWVEKAETEWGPWGTVYYEAGERVLGSMQYGPANLFPRAAELPAGPPSSDAVLITCAYLRQTTTLWVTQSLFLAAIGDAKERGARALETFGYRYREGETHYERFLVHKTIFPLDFLADFGFATVRSAGRVELCRLELGGLEPASESVPIKALRKMKEAFLPAPVPDGYRGF